MRPHLPPLPYQPLPPGPLPPGGNTNPIPGTGNAPRPPKPLPTAPPPPLWHRLPWLRKRDNRPPAPPKDRYWLHVLLLILSIGTTTLAGAEMMTGKRIVLEDGLPELYRLGWGDLLHGLPYSLCFLLFLLTHEFGHYFMARRHRVPVSLPYLLPVFIPGMLLNVGSFGATIRIRRQPRTTGEYFDIGIAGPLAGFGVAIGLLVVGFLTLPPLEYVHQWNPLRHATPADIATMHHYWAENPQVHIRVGSSLLFEGIKHLVANPERIPSHLDLMHYPLLFVGFLALFFTSLNLLPIGQLDGGHVTYGLFGRRRAGLLSRGVILALVLYGGWGLADFRYDGAEWVALVYLGYLLLVLRPLVKKRWQWYALVGGVVAVQQLAQLTVGAPDAPGVTWLVFALLGARMVKPDHPPAYREHPLDPRRRVLGWLSIGIFVICFSPAPLAVQMGGPSPESPPEREPDRMTQHWVEPQIAAQPTHPL